MSDKFRAREAVEGRQAEFVRMLVAAVQEREAESARVSGILHDQVSQILSAIGLQLDVMRLDFMQQAPGIEERTTEIQEMLERVINQLRDLSFELNPSVVERAGLSAALDRLAGRVRDRFRGAFRLYVDPTVRIPTRVAAAFYKITERAVEDCVSHTACTDIEIQVKRAQSNFVVEIHHDGDTSQLPAEERSFMVMMLEHYAARSDVELKIQSSAHGGTVIRASYPVAGHDGANASA